MVGVPRPAGARCPWRAAATTFALCWRESRPVVQIIFALRFLTGFVLAGAAGGAAPLRSLVALPLWTSATMAIYVVNGCSDVIEDRINGSRRPVARGLLPVRHALITAGALATTAVVGTCLLSPTLALLCVALLILGVVYSVPPIAAKRWTPAAVVVIALAGFCTYLGGGVTAGRPGPAVPVAILLTTWMAVIGGLVKDLSDAPGDTAAGRHTVVGRRGERSARRVAAVAAAGIGASATLAAALGPRTLLPPAVVIAVGSVVVSLLALSGDAGSSRSARRRPYRGFMVVQYLAHAAVLVFAVPW